MTTTTQRYRQDTRRPYSALAAAVLLGASALGAEAQLGTLDPSFHFDGRAVVAFDMGGDGDDQAFDVALQRDGRAVIVGDIAVGSGDFDFGVARIDPGGSLDLTFGANGRTTVAFDLGGSMRDLARAVAIQPDGKILVAGIVQLDASGDFDFGVARLIAQGSLDPEGLLEGTGKIMRHVKLRPDDDIDAGALMKLIETAYTDMKGRLKSE